MAKKKKNGIVFTNMVTADFPCGNTLYATKDGIWLGDSPMDGYNPNFTWPDVDRFLAEASKLRVKKGGKNGGK